MSEDEPRTAAVPALMAAATLTPDGWSLWWDPDFRVYMARYDGHVDWNMITDGFRPDLEHPDRKHLLTLITQQTRYLAFTQAIAATTLLIVAAWPVTRPNRQGISTGQPQPA